MTVVLTSPTHGSYVQRVDLSGHDQPLDPQTNIPRHDGWIYDFFKKVVPLLPNLTFIQYDGLPTLHPCFYISPPRVPSLTSLSLSGLNATSIGDVLRLISYYKRLKELYITQSGGAWGPFSNHHYSFGQRWSCHLQVLSIQRCTVSDIFDLFHWLAQLRTPCSFEHLVLTWGYGRHSRDLERAPMRSIPEHIALGWARTLKSLSLDFLLEPDDESPLFKSILVSRVLPFIKTCSNLHTIRLASNPDRYEILQYLPDVLPSLKSLRRFALRIGRKFDEVLQGESGERWVALDRVFVDAKKLPKLQYVEVMWPSNSILRKQERGKTSNTNGDGLNMSDRVSVYVDILKDHFAGFHLQKPLKSIFPHLSARGILWYSLFNKAILGFGGVDSFYALQISPEISSPSWRPRYRQSLLDPDLRPDYH
ncbi:hypothetical protein NLI96_g7729 [Meripilus lineatus]|uniref:Uncharacterized protein n=1 Tax=Meripilus lineatus TaxID=2056292 RepID=A0AAD5V0H8_9APHY|nr:hypothetical protein NLI96_g7729 [Physisporinus lineatus]